MASVSIRPDSVIRFLRTASADKVEDLYDDFTARLKALGVKPDGRKRHKGKVPDGSTNVNVAGIRRWLGCFLSETELQEKFAEAPGAIPEEPPYNDEDLGHLLCFHATLAARL